MIEADISVEAPGWEALAGLEDLALRVAQLEHRLRLLERDRDA